MSTMMKKCTSFLLGIFLFMAIGVSACADGVLVVTQTSGFEPVTKEEYVKHVAQSSGKTEEEVLADIEKASLAVRAEYGVEDDEEGAQSASFDQTYSEYQGDGVTFLYGYVYFIDAYGNEVYEVRSECYAIVAAHHYGRTYASVDTSTASVFAVSDGTWELESGNAQATEIDNTKLLISYSAIIDTPMDDAVSAGVDMEFFDYTTQIGTVDHCRKHISNGNTQEAQYIGS